MFRIEKDQQVFVLRTKTCWSYCFLLTLIVFTNKVVCITLLSYNDRICFLMCFTSCSFQYLYLGSRDNQECLLCKRSYH